MEIIYWPATLFLSIVKMHLLLFTLLKFEKKLSKAFLWIIAASIGLALVMGYAYSLGVVHEDIMMASIPFMTLGCTLFGLKKIKHSAMAIGIFVCLAMVETALAGLLYEISNTPVEMFWAQYFRNLSVDIASTAIVLVIVTLNRRSKEPVDSYWLNSKYFNIAYYLLLSTFSLLLYYPPLQMYYLTSQEAYSLRNLIGVTISTIVFIFANVTCYVNIIRKEKNLGKALLYESMLHQQKKYYNTLLDNNSIISSLNHDMQAHLFCISSYLEEGKVLQAKDYTDNLHKVIRNKTTPKLQSGNRIIDMLLAQITEHPESIDIQLHGKAPDQITVTDIDLCILFSNILNNAQKEAALCEIPFIEITFRYAHGTLSCVVTNPIHSPVLLLDNLPIRKNGQPSFGIRNMLSIVDKYGGIIDFSQTHNTFSVETILLGITEG